MESGEEMGEVHLWRADGKSPQTGKMDNMQIYNPVFIGADDFGCCTVHSAIYLYTNITTDKSRRGTWLLLFALCP